MPTMIYLSLYSLLLILSTLVSSTLFSDSWNGTTYRDHSSVQRSHAEHLLDHIPLTGNEHVLDVGCGDGKLSFLLAKKLPSGSVIGIDPSPSMLKKAQELSTPNLSFISSSAETFSLNQKFDHIISVHVMHWIKEQELALKNLYNHLKPEGQIHLILSPSKEGLPFYRALQNTLANWSEEFIDFVNPQQTFDIETYRNLIVQAGFHIQSLQYIYHESIHANQEYLKLWIQQWLPHGKYLPLNKQDPFFKELMRNYLLEIQSSPDTTEPVLWREYVLIIEATKPI